MANALFVKSLTKTAFGVALMTGSALAMAQEAPIAAPAPAPAAPVEAAPVVKVAPPPLVSTLPSKNDVVNPAALQEIEEERQANAAPPVARNKAPAKTQPRTAPARQESAVSGQAEATAPTFNEPTSPATPSLPSTIETITAPDNAADVPVAEPSTGSADNDLPLFAGIAAALAALGLGGLFLARRSRSVPVKSAPRVENAVVAPSTPAPTPVQSFVAPSVSTQQPKVRESVNTRPDVPVTDPLFSRTTVAGQITDPMFAPRNDVQTPITDPLFAGRQGFDGRLQDKQHTPAAETVK